MEVTKMRIVSLFTFAIFLVAAGLTRGRPAQAQIAGPEKVGTCQSNGGRPAPASCQNFMAGQKDVNGKFIGGTEMRYLIEHTIPHGDPFNGGTCADAAGIVRFQRVLGGRAGVVRGVWTSVRSGARSFHAGVERRRVEGGCRLRQ
jgi:hypothetical protein